VRCCNDRGRGAVIDGERGSGEPEFRCYPRTLLTRVSPEVRTALVGLGRFRRWGAKQTILRHDADDDHVVLLLDGVTKVLVHSRGGVDVLLGIAVGGDVIGEMTAFDGGRRSADVVTCVPVEGIVVKRVDFEAFLDENQRLAREVVRMLVERLRWANRRTAAVGETALAAVAGTLVELADLYGEEVDAGVMVRLPLTQVEVGSLARVRSRTVQNQIRTLRRRGLYRSQYRKYLLPNVEALREVAETE
jgi:CRP-like cAMP-binding protein